MASTERLQVDINNRVIVGHLAPVALLLGLGHQPGDTPAASLVADILLKIQDLKIRAMQAPLAPKVTLNREHSHQFRILNIDNEVVWSDEWQTAGEDWRQRLKAETQLEEMRQRGTDFGMTIQRYQRCTWVNITTQAHDEEI
jgi:hypothetical protein